MTAENTGLAARQSRIYSPEGFSTSRDRKSAETVAAPQRRPSSYLTIALKIAKARLATGDRQDRHVAVQDVIRLLRDVPAFWHALGASMSLHRLRKRDVDKLRPVVMDGAELRHPLMIAAFKATIDAILQAEPGRSQP